MSNCRKEAISQGAVVKTGQSVTGELLRQKFGISEASLKSPVPLLLTRVTLGKPLYFSVPLFPHL